MTWHYQSTPKWDPSKHTLALSRVMANSRNSSRSDVNCWGMTDEPLFNADVRLSTALASCVVFSLESWFSSPNEKPPNLESGKYMYKQVAIRFHCFYTVSTIQDTSIRLKQQQEQTYDLKREKWHSNTLNHTHTHTHTHKLLHAHVCKHTHTHTHTHTPLLLRLPEIPPQMHKYRVFFHHSTMYYKRTTFTSLVQTFSSSSGPWSSPASHWCCAPSRCTGGRWQGYSALQALGPQHLTHSYGYLNAQLVLKCIVQPNFMAKFSVFMYYVPKCTAGAGSTLSHQSLVHVLCVCMFWNAQLVLGVHCPAKV